ncbi:MAG: sortase, partial [Anaerolineales bacterium]
WLGTSVGWLEGSAYPTWSGNTVLTAHVWNADNTPGVFAKIKDLKYGDRFTIRASGQTYIYEVRENVQLRGASRVDKVFQHEELDWVTLLTCEGYNPLTGNYLFRRMVRAVLVEVK